MTNIALSLGLTAVLFGVVLGAIWLAAYNEFWWCFVPANTIAFVTWGDSDSTDVANLTGGELDRIIHGVPGKKLITTKKDGTEEADPFKWHFEKGEEERGFLHQHFGIQWIGYGRSLRVNQVHEIRFKKTKRVEKDADGKDVERDVYDIEGKDYPSKFIYYSREQAVDVSSSETQGTYELDLKFDLLYAMKRPFQAIFGMSDPNSVLTGLVDQAVNSITGPQLPEYFLQGGTKEKGELVTAVKKIRGKVEKKIGIDITTVILLSLDIDAKTRELLELNATTERENRAAIAVAEKDKQVAILAGEAKAEAQMRVNASDADRVARVLEPLGKIPHAAGIRFAEAIEKNETLTTLVVGGKTAQLVGAK